MPTLLTNLLPALTLGAAESGVIPQPLPTGGPWWIALIPAIPLLAAILALVYLGARIRTKLPAWSTVVLLGVAFFITLAGFVTWQGTTSHDPYVITVWHWITASWSAAPGGTFNADVGFYLDGLSWLWMLFVTGLSALIGLYASEYMAGDRGYARFFAGFALFVVAMSCLVMADNLVLLYLGWEGVGLCSYLLIGYFYQKPSAVAAAKKAFIVNRIGDLGLAIGIFLTFTTFGTVQYDQLFQLVGSGIAPHDIAGNPIHGWVTWAIPCLFMLGAFGKSAQLPLYVWLPDAMEGPTPVSALIHAATMVTAGVYLIARMFPVFAGFDGGHVALTVVAWIGTLTALLAATIGMAQFDIKRIMAYSTVSQLGYMFAGLGFLTTTGAAFHVFTHAFFKAILFLACGAVMHGFAGQLDLRKLSGLWKLTGWKIVVVAMLVGCLNLSGVPFTAGFFSKDMIIAEGFVTPGQSLLAWILLITAGMTAYYTFRVFFRVFVGPVDYQPGDEHHGDHDQGGMAGSPGHGDASHDTHHAESHDADDHAHDAHAGGFHPHAPGWAINTVLAILAIGALTAAAAYFVHKDANGWVGSLLQNSTAHYVSPYAHHEQANAAPSGDMPGLPMHGEASLARSAPMLTVLPAADAHESASHEAGTAASHAEAGTFFGMNPHAVMFYVSAVFGLIGILAAAFLHGPKGAAGLFIGSRTEAATSRADKLLPFLGPIPKWAQNKWYVDELYDHIIRIPLRVLSHLFHLFDKLVIDGIVGGIGALPRFIAEGIRPSQSGVLQGYASGMAFGLALILLLVFLML